MDKELAPFYPSTKIKLRAEYNDGGRAESSYPNERWDCAVRAVAIVLGLPYDDVHKAFARRGRKFGDGVYDEIFDAVLWELSRGIANVYEKRSIVLQSYTDELGQTFKGRRYSTVQEVARYFIEASVIVSTYIEFRGNKYPHLCAIVNGVVQDMFLPYNQPVERLWLILKT